MDLLEVGELNLLKLPIKMRNEIADAFFYDVGALSGDDLAALNPWVDRKGTIIVVPPARTGRPIRHYPNTLRFLADQEPNSHDVQALVVAGVGSSVLGTAALARNVADAYGFDVAGVVTGFGVASLVQEGLGGWFFYGAIDRWRSRLEDQLANVLAVLEDVFKADSSAKEALSDYLESLISPLDAVVPGDMDTAAIHDLMFSRFLFGRPAKLRLLVSHSKGNLLISYILNHMVDELKSQHGKMPREPFKNMAVVTLGAVVDIPQELFKPGSVHQFLGKLDCLGAMNSDRNAGGIKAHTNVPGAGHHLNRSIPMHMAVADVLATVTLPPLQPKNQAGHWKGHWIRPVGRQSTALAQAHGKGIAVKTRKRSAIRPA